MGGLGLYPEWGSLDSYYAYYDYCLCSNYRRALCKCLLTLKMTKSKKPLPIGELLIDFGDEVRGDSRGWMADQELGELVGKHEKRFNRYIKDLLEGLYKWIDEEATWSQETEGGWCGDVMVNKDEVLERIDKILKGGK